MAGHIQGKGSVKIKLTNEQLISLAIEFRFQVYKNRIFRTVHIQHQNGTITKTSICLN